MHPEASVQGSSDLHMQILKDSNKLKSDHPKETT